MGAYMYCLSFEGSNIAVVVGNHSSLHSYKPSYTVVILQVQANHHNNQLEKNHT